MATRKITITLGEDQLQEIRASASPGRAANISGFVQHAVALTLLDAAEWKEMLEEALQQTGGPLTPKERAWADFILCGSKGKARVKKGKAARPPSMPAV
jgi:Arc/MetJ-type ribon-helix-helix transcriptional regulator